MFKSDLEQLAHELAMENCRMCQGSALYYSLLQTYTTQLNAISRRLNKTIYLETPDAG
jgi:hypothetical protein